MIVLIPAYKPDGRLIELVEDLRESGAAKKIVVVDDGCGADYAHIFESVSEKGAAVLTHDVNKGKGRALKTGFQYILENYPGEGAVIADADGQHLPEDIINVGKELEKYPGTLILGARKFEGDVPLKSLTGNAITRAVFMWATGTPVSDTQTGLRGIPALLMPDFIKLKGERYDLEMNMLMYAAKIRAKYRQVVIKTVYHNDNEGSHYRAFRDGYRVYKILFSNCLHSFSAAFADIAVFAAAIALLPNGMDLILRIIIAVIAGRLTAVIIKRFGRKAHIQEGRSEAYKTAVYAVAVWLLGAPLGINLIAARVIASLVTGSVILIYLNSRSKIKE